MTFTGSLLVLTWIVIVLMAFALAGCLRAIRLLDLKVHESMGEPRRLSIGDRLELPAHLLDHVSTSDRQVIFFGTSGCRSCRTAASALDGAAEELGPVILLWADEVPGEFPSSVSLANQIEVHEKLKVGLTPFAVVLEEGQVVVRSGLGSRERLDRFVELGRVGTKSETKGAVDAIL